MNRGCTAFLLAQTIECDFAPSHGPVVLEDCTPQLAGRHVSAARPREAARPSAR